MNADLTIWVVCKDPSDYPGLYVARRHVVSAGQAGATAQIIMRNTLDELQAILMGQGYVRLPRHDDDDPVIVESWI